MDPASEMTPPASWTGTILDRDAPAETPQAAPPEPLPAVEPERDYSAELAQKDLELKAMEERMATMEGASKEENEKFLLEIARMVNERNAIEAAQKAELLSKQEALDEVSQATQSLVSKTKTLEQQLADAQAEATTLRVLSQEFPNLLRYSQFIPKSANAEEVRGYCSLFEKARETDLGEYRQLVSGGNVVRTAPVGAPATRVAEPFADVTQLEDRLFDAALNNRSLFEAELQAAVRQLGLQKTS